MNKTGRRCDLPCDNAETEDSTVTRREASVVSRLLFPLSVAEAARRSRWKTLAAAGKRQSRPPPPTAPFDEL